jgi:D-alanyl-D-alanine carboxypeptidase
VILKHDKLADGTEIMYTLGCLGETRFEGHRKIAHAGDIYGFSANYAYYPDDDLVIVITTNNQGGAFPPLSVEQKIAREMLGVPQPVVKSLPVPADLAASVSGDYYFAPYRFGPEVHGFSFKDGQLYLNFGGTKSGGPALPLLYQGAGRFVSVVDDEHNVVFKPGKRGKPATLTMQYYGGTFSAQQVDAK